MVEFVSGWLDGVSWWVGWVGGWLSWWVDGWMAGWVGGWGELVGGLDGLVGGLDGWLVGGRSHMYKYIYIHIFTGRGLLWRLFFND